jgi:hypothetical protein
MARTYWQTAPQIEWLSLSIVQRMIVQRTPAERDDVLARCRDGRIRSRVVNGALQVADDALLNFLDTLTPVKPAPDTFIKIGGKVYREV